MLSHLHRFEEASGHYVLGRPGYPATFVRRVVEAAGLHRRHRLLDLGCGPGTVAIGFAPHVGSVLAVDPEPGMLAEARAAVARAGVKVEVLEGSSLTLGPAWGRFQAVTMGRSFHWMDRAETLRRLDPMIDRGGAVILLGENQTATDAPSLRAWQEIIDRYAAGDPGRAEVKSPDYPPHQGMLRASAFSALEEVKELEERTTGVEDLVHRAYSISSTTEKRLGTRAAAMAEEIRAALAPFDGPEGIRETLEWTALIARRSTD
jgi:SAM-dependent methyltransferase